MSKCHLNMTLLEFCYIVMHVVTRENEECFEDWLDHDIDWHTTIICHNRLVVNRCTESGMTTSQKMRQKTGKRLLVY